MNREQQRAKNAFAVVHGGGLGKEKDFLTLARQLPTMFQTNGLLASWTFLLSKARKEQRHGRVLEACLEHLGSAGLVEASDGRTPEEVLKTWLGYEGRTPLGVTGLQRITEEAILYSAWLKRAAEAVLTGAAQQTAAPPEGGGAP